MCLTSASSRNVVVSDQFRIVTPMWLPPLEKESFSILVNGHGPAIQETRTSWKELFSPASSETPPMAAFHLPSGEQGPWRSQGMSPVFTTSKVFNALPALTAMSLLVAQSTRISAI